VNDKNTDWFAGPEEEDIRHGLITTDQKQTGKPIAGNRHDGFEVAGVGNQFTDWLMRHSQRKRGETDRPDLRSTAPVLDPTGVYAAASDREFRKG